jgi:hypothetical protein
MKLIHNRFESVVVEKIQAEASKWPNLAENPGLLADAACIALNALRPHYIRHDLDLSFFLTDASRAQEEIEVSAAVEAALQRVQGGDNAETPLRSR